MKNDFRHKFLKARNCLSLEFIKSAEEKASQTFLSSAFSVIPEGKSIMLYADFKNEIGTQSIIDALYSAGTTIVLPYTKKNIIQALIYDGPNSLITDSLGIPSPDRANCPAADLNSIHTVIVPGIAFDPQGNRIGFGKGCYDSFLPKIPQAIKIGLCYQFQVCPQLPNNAFDVPMDWLLTEAGLIKCHRLAE